MNYDQIASDCLELSELAASSVKKYFRGNLDVDMKADLSPVTIADRSTEELIRNAITKKYPSHGILGEEEGAAGLDREYLWIIDPIDGTKSFISGYPLFGFLIALLHNGKPIASAVSMPMLDEVFSAVAGVGAKLNGQPIQTSDISLLSEAKIYINDVDKILTDIPELLPKLLKCGNICRFSHDCYPHALLAAGFLDVVVEYDLKAYDFLPLLPVIEAAGGIISDWKGRPLDLHYEGPVVSAANQTIHTQIIETIGY